jgi:lambda repressor-like predicted transcriptional regulator
MFKKLGIVLGAAVAVGLVGLLVVSAALAQGSTPTATTTSQTGVPQGKLGLQGRGAPGAGGPNGGVDEIAKLLNMTPDRIWAERVLGKTISDLAKEKGVSNQQLVDALVASQKTMLDQAVTDGRLTRAQADKWLEWYKQTAALQLTEPYAGGFGGMPGGFGALRVRGFGGMPGRGPMGQPGNAAPQPQAPTP